MIFVLSLATFWGTNHALGKENYSAANANLSNARDRQHLSDAQVLGLFTIHAPRDATDRYGL